MEQQKTNLQGTLLSASCLKSRWSWRYGQLWLFPDGILRAPLPWWVGAAQMYAYRPTVTPGNLESHVFNEQAFLALTHHPKCLWIAREQIAKAHLGGDAWTESLAIELHDGRSLKLFWMRPDNAAAPLAQTLSTWLGANLTQEEAQP